jgi:hypothetical protein
MHWNLHNGDAVVELERSVIVTTEDGDFILAVFLYWSLGTGRAWVNTEGPKT